MTELPFARGAKPAIIVPIMARTGEAAVRQAIAASSHDAVDVLEWRIDPLVADSSEWRDELAPSYDAFVRTRIPTLVTVRSDAEGGFCPVDSYTDAVQAAIALGPAAVDVEMSRDNAEPLMAAAGAAGVASVASAHAWDSTPEAAVLEELYAAMAAAGADVAKIAVLPQSVEDVLTLLTATHRAASTLPIPVIGIAMGELGRVTRLCAAEFGSAATFATVGAGSAPGQMRADHVDIVRSILRS